LVAKFGPSPNKVKKDKNRGNFQITFGISCEQNVGAAKTDEGTFKFAGCTQPRLTNDSGWQVGKKMGIDYCQDDFLAVNAWAQPTFDLVKYLRGGTGFAAMSLCLLEERDGCRISLHTDDGKDPKLSTVLNITELLLLDGKWIRVSLIFFMRKSVHDMLLRQPACREVADQCVRFLDTCALKVLVDDKGRKKQTDETYRLPPDARKTPEEEVKAYFEGGVGSDGMIVTVDH
jgi:hypothetical protein